MFLSYLFVTALSNLNKMPKTIFSLTVFSKFDCAVVCCERMGCSSFYFNQFTKSCVPSPHRFVASSAFGSFANKYGYFVIRPDCSGKWEFRDGQCYLLIEERTRGYSAQSHCLKLGGFLAKTDSLHDNDIILSFVKGTRFWIGANDIAIEKRWVWRDGSKVNLSLWAPGEPNHYSNQDCVLQGARGWVDHSCYSRYPFLCEK